MKSFYLALLAASSLLVPAAAARAEEARRIDPAATANLSTAPTIEKPKLIPKGIRSGPAIEVSRTYVAAGALVPKGGTDGTLVAKSAYIEINNSDGSVKREPYVEVPLLFRVRTADLLDANSRTNVVTVIDRLRQVMADHPDAHFRVEGHASKEGHLDANEKLALDRAHAIEATLRKALRPSPEALCAVGRGVQDAVAPASAPEQELQKDRRVLVVREQ